MAYTIPSSWQNIDGTHHVAPRAPIVGGDTGDYAFDGLIQDHHLVRADRMTCALSMGNADGWTNTNGPGAGVADWPTFGKSKFETQDGFDGQLDVIVWAKDCEAGGGVYVAVFNTSGTLQTSLTLTNTATATKEELTGSLTGLSASTEYQIEVRFAASASSTPVATLYGVVVTPRALTAANIDDKLDDSRANDDESASSLVPFLIRQNLIASMRERMPHCTTALPEFGNINAPKVSTHPEEWWGIPIRVPVPRGADTVSVRIRYEVTIADVRVRLRVMGGSVGDYVALSATGSVGLSGEISAPMRSNGIDRSAIVMLSFQSRRGSVINSISSASGATETFSRTYTTVATSTPATKDSVIVGGVSTYIGGLEPGGGVRIWPARSPSDMYGNIYSLGKIKVYSIGMAIKAHASDLNDFYVPSTKIMTVGKGMQFETVQHLASAAREIYSSSAQWYTMRPTQGGRSGFFGVTNTAGVPAAGAILERREDSDGVEISLLVITDSRGFEGRNRSIDTVVTIQNISAGVTSTTTVIGSMGNEIWRGLDTRLAADGATLTGDYATTDWGSQDLIRETEAENLGVIEGVVEWPAGSSVGDTLEVSCSFGTNVRHVYGASIREYVTPPIR